MDQQAFLNQSEEVRTSYLVILSAVASADHENSEEEVAFMEQIAGVAGLKEDSLGVLKEAMTNPGSVDLKAHLDNFKGNDLKFALITDLLNLAHKDGELESEEVVQIQKATAHLEINDEQFDALQQYVKAANKEVDDQEGNAELNDTGELKGEMNNFLQKTGLDNTFSKAGIPTNNFQSGSTIGSFLTSAAFSVLKGYLSGGQQSGQGGSGSLLSGAMGSIIGNMLGGGQNQNQGQGGNVLGSIVSGFFKQQAPTSGQGQAGGQSGSPLSNILGSVLQASGKGKGLGNLTDIIGGGKKTQGGGGSPLGNILSSFLK
ncbi:MAG: hypothetical protein AAFU64_19990 [Bacteroidota bacterium]